MSADESKEVPQEEPEATPPPIPEAIPKAAPPQAAGGMPAWVIVLIVCGCGFGVVIVLGILAGFMLPALGKAQAAARHAACLRNIRQIGMAMKIYAYDHDDEFMELVGADGHTERGVREDGTISSLPSRSGFAILLHQAYLTTAGVFICRSSNDRVVDDTFPSDFKEATLDELLFEDTQCSYGWDPTKRNWAHATCAILADKPPQDVSRANEGTARNNSDNHDGEGQCVFYNDGHVKWATTSKPDGGDDPDFYLGDTGYETSNTDAKIIR